MLVCLFFFFFFNHLPADSLITELSSMAVSRGIMVVYKAAGLEGLPRSAAVCQKHMRFASKAQGGGGMCSAA